MDLDQLKRKAELAFYSGLIGGMISVVNKALKFVVRQLSEFEKWETQTQVTVSISFKLALLRFINSTCILVATNTDAKTWFSGGGLVYDANILICIMCGTGPVLTLFEPSLIIKKFMKNF